MIRFLCLICFGIVNKFSNSESVQILNCNNAGTVFRFLTALLAITPGKWHLTGSGRMKERPVGILVDSLIQLGAKIQYAEKKGFPSLLIEGTKLQGGKVEDRWNNQQSVYFCFVDDRPCVAEWIGINDHKPHCFVALYKNDA